MRDATGRTAESSSRRCRARGRAGDAPRSTTATARDRPRHARRPSRAADGGRADARPSPPTAVDAPPDEAEPVRRGSARSARAVAAAPIARRGRPAASSPTRCTRPGSGSPSPSPARASSASSTRWARAGHPGRGDPPRGRRRVHGRGVRPADGPARGRLATRAVGAANLAIGIHTARADSTPMFALIGQVPRAVPRPGGVPGGRPRRLDRPARRPTRSRSTIRPACPRRWPRPPATPSAVGPGRSLIAVPEDLLDEPMPAGAEVAHVDRGSGRPIPIPTTSGRVHPPPHRRPSGRSSSPAPASSARARRPTSSASPRSSTCRSSPRGGGPTSSPTTIRCTSGMTGYAAPARAPGAAGRRRTSSSSSAAGSTSPPRWTIACPDRASAGPTSISSRARPGPASTAPTWRSRPTPGRSSGSRRGSWPAPCTTRTGLDARRAANAADRAAWEAATVVDGGAWDGPGVHPGRIVATLERVLPPDAIVTTDAGNFAGLARPRLPLPAAGHVPRPDLRRDGLRPAGGDRRLARPPRAAGRRAGPATAASAMTMAELETAVRERCRIVLIVFDNRRYGTIRMHQAIAGHGRRRRDRARAHRRRARSPRASARGASAWTSDEGFEAALEEALAARWPDRHPPARSTAAGSRSTTIRRSRRTGPAAGRSPPASRRRACRRPLRASRTAEPLPCRAHGDRDLPPRGGGDMGGAGARRRLRAGLTRRGGFRPLHRRGRRVCARPATASTATTRGRTSSRRSTSAASADALALRRRGTPVPARLPADPARRGDPDRARAAGRRRELPGLPGLTRPPGAARPGARGPPCARRYSRPVDFPARHLAT